MTRLSLWGWLTGCALICAACGDATTPILPDVGGQIDISLNKPNPPVLDPTATPQQTCDDEVAVKGNAESGVNVFATGGQGSGVSTTASATTGSFCLPVRLRPGELNTIEVRAQAVDRGVSDPVFVQVLHQAGCAGSGTGGTGSGPRPPENIAPQATVKVYNDKTPLAGTPAQLNDGNKTAYVEYEFDNDEGWFWFTLSEVKRVRRVKVFWRADEDYASEYKVLVSQLDTPSDPNESDGQWTVVGDITNGDGGEDTTELGDITIKHVAIVLINDNNTDWGLEDYDVREIEIWDTPPEPPPPPTGGVCGAL